MRLTIHNIKAYMKKALDFIFTQSLKEAAKAQKLKKMIDRLEEKITNISDQYSSTDVNSPYLKRKVRNMHGFQMKLVDKILGEFEKPFIVDIGDSAGTHLLYIKRLYPEKKEIKCLSVNLDERAVTKIKNKGLEAIQARAEELHNYNLNPDIILCFELIEHLTDPASFLYDLSKTSAKYLVMTVPYLRRSRVGLHHIRQGYEENRDAEDTHIFELNPADWKLLVRHCGWDVAEEAVYTQYPRIGFWTIIKPLWKRFDFEGFYGMVLKKDAYWSSKYKDWKR